MTSQAQLEARLHTVKVAQHFARRSVEFSYQKMQFRNGKTLEDRAAYQECCKAARIIHAEVDQARRNWMDSFHKG